MKESKPTEQTTCPFCGTDERVLKENEHAVVVLSNPRKVPGHFLVVPRRHVEQPWDLTKDELSSIFDLIFFVEQRIVGKLGDGCDVRQNYRPFMQKGKLSVRHTHFHVIPRSLEDYIYQVSEKYDTELFADLDPLEAREVAKLLQ
ncbi:HIT family protein [Candidatus Saccharibacteria bacterium]|nr:HIT family protein [Candidatus Saccharibacteria bacterium]